ncbi:DNA topoisomerase IV subunit A [Amylibacter sp.]|jgi:topoisomerase-4 subunit A|nr:DNA topoisomerase IV subunit A [Rhodobacterales bacterium]MDB3882752.1 DNA topoisomerase IV subunit A [Amylibacter sp.]MBT4471209.1 DNA topoisomerase IV subunit A [Rhodobacterales bacterium]MBT7560667.1 DNA topoisomerase IV subunit A [Rhodobacterales bacterium]MDB3964981.1 DNA topoisomerase IV subunit A [Amylibacter sp.]
MANLINKNNEDDGGGSTLSEPLRRAIGDRYLTYALSTIMHRALPDARDGLKPVHRRILYAMYRLKLVSNGKFLKSAKISGDTMGDFHPHGDAAIYDAMARLAQDFSVRYPMVDGQGNFGNIDGDNPAAARYTEARMTAVAEAMLIGMEENAVDFQDNYDGRLTEPSVLPASFPNLLANGSTGIAVGMATNIPPHNIGELLDASIHLIKAPNARDETLLDFVPGPDFPTGGILVEPRDSLLETYRTGRGPMRLRSKWEIEDLPRGLWQIVVTEIPYQVQKSKLIEKIAELIQLKKLPILADVRDESAEDIRLVLEPRAKTVDPTVLMETLFRMSDLEVRFNLNLNTLIDGRTPKVCSMKEVLRAFIDHKRDVLLRRSKHRMDKIDHRLEVLEGYIVAFLNLDRVIEIIRNEDEPKKIMMKEFSLSDVQVEAILNMRLRSLRKLEEIELRTELDSLQLERADLDDLLASEKMQWERIINELRETRKVFGKNSDSGNRRTELAEAPDFEEVPIEAMIEKEPITVVCSSMGWLRAMKGHVDLSQELKYKDGDEKRFVFHAETTDKLLMFGGNGRFYTMSCSELPGGRGMGEPIRLIVDLPNDANMVDLFIHQPDRKLLLASSAGDGFVVEENDIVAQTRTGKQALNVKGDITALICKPVLGDYVATVGQNRKVLIFPIDELPVMSRGKGVRMQKYKDGGLNDATTFHFIDGLSWLDPAGRRRIETELADWIGKRAGAGRMAPRGFPRENKFT